MKESAEAVLTDSLQWRLRKNHGENKGPYRKSAYLVLRWDLTPILAVERNILYGPVSLRGRYPPLVFT